MLGSSTRQSVTQSLVGLGQAIYGCVSVPLGELSGARASSLYFFEARLDGGPGQPVDRDREYHGYGDNAVVNNSRCTLCSWRWTVGRTALHNMCCGEHWARKSAVRPFAAAHKERERAPRRALCTPATAAAEAAAKINKNTCSTTERSGMLEWPLELKFSSFSCCLCHWSSCALI